MCVFAKWSAYEVSVKMKLLTVLQLISGHWSYDNSFGAPSHSLDTFGLGDYYTASSFVSLLVRQSLAFRASMPSF